MRKCAALVAAGSGRQPGEASLLSQGRAAVLDQHAPALLDPVKKSAAALAEIAAFHQAIAESLASDSAYSLNQTFSK